MKLLISIIMLTFTVLGLATIPDRASASNQFPLSSTATNLIPLHAWYSPGRGDNFATTDPRWSGSEGETRSPDYRWSGIQGYVIDPASPQPPDTVPLYSWYSPTRGDNFITSDEHYRPSSSADISRPPYRFVRLEGYIYDKPLAGTLPLQSHWSRGREDNFATTHYSWIGDIGRPTSPDYGLYRTEGYVVGPNAEDVTPHNRDSFGIGRASFDQKSDVPVEGTRPLAVIMVQNSDVTFRHSRAYYESLLFTDPTKNMVSYYREMSRGKFTWSKAGLLGPYTHRDVPETSIDESSYHCTSADPVLCPGVTGSWERTIPWAIQLAARDFDFSRYDRDRDGTLESHELGVMLVGAHPDMDPDQRDTTRFPRTNATSGATRSSGAYGGCFPVSGVSFCAKVAGVGEGTSTANAAHELFHVLDTGIDNDIYGSGSYGASLMGATVEATEDMDRRFHLDPWHKMRAGWVEPVIRPILPQIPPASAHLISPQVEPSLYSLYHPVLFLDPGRGPSDMFLVEHRQRKGFDSNAADQGLAVWFARVDRTLNPFETPRETRRPLLGDRVWSTTKVGQTLWSLGSGGLRRGIPRFWRSEHGAFRPGWYPNPVAGQIVTPNTPSGLRLQVGQVKLNGIDVEWRTNDDPYLARIDQIRRVSDSYEMRGDFGLHGTKVARLEPPKGGTGYDLPIRSWQADVIEFLVPKDVPEGEYFVRVYTDGSLFNGGNHLPLFISRTEGPF